VQSVFLGNETVIFPCPTGTEAQGHRGRANLRAVKLLEQIHESCIREYGIDEDCDRCFAQVQKASALRLYVQGSLLNRRNSTIVKFLNNENAFRSFFPVNDDCDGCSVHSTSVRVREL
jgi:hypothetical protein